MIGRTTRKARWIAATSLASSVSITVGCARTPQPRPSQPPSHVLRDTEIRVLPPTAQGRRYQLHVSLPASYAKQTTQRYPVLFVTDAYWDFAGVRAAYDGLSFDRLIPELVIIGLGYAGEGLHDEDYARMRWWDLSPVEFGPVPESGHAEELLESLEDVIIPFVDREYRTVPEHRALAGASLGGLFALFVMHTRPELFGAYIAISPIVDVEDRWFFEYEEAFAASGRTLSGRLHLTAAQWEWPSLVSAIVDLRDRLEGREYPGLVLEFRVIESARHAGTKSEGFVRGMQHAFAPLAPESGPMTDDWRH